MGWGFGTWDANGADNNTGLVRINALATLQAGNGTTGTFSFALPSGYTLDFLVQPGGLATGRRRIAVSGNTLVLSNVGDTDFSAGTYPRYDMSFILAYAR